MTMLRRWLAGLLVTGLLLIVVLALLWRFWRPGLDQYQAHLAPPAASGQTLTASWFGVSAVLIRDERSAIFIDPFFSRPGGALHLLANPALVPDEAAIQRGLQQAGVERLDAVMVSHSHYDHAMDAGLVARLTGASLIGSSSTLNIGRGAGLAEDRLQLVTPGEALRVGGFEVLFLVSAHAGATGGRPLGEVSRPLVPPARLGDYRQGGTYSILLRHPAGNILHHGSAGFRPGALAAHHADSVLLGVALIDDLERYLDEVVRATGARRVFPLHWDDFTRPLHAPLSPMPLVVRLDRLFRDFPADLELQTLPLGRPVALLPPGQE